MSSRSRCASLLAGLGIIASTSMATVATDARAATPHNNAHRNQSAPNTRAAHAHCRRPTPKGVITYSDTQFPDSLNPDQTDEAVSVETEAGMFDTAMFFNARGKLVPDLLTAVPSAKNGGIKSGGREYIFHLRHGLQWSNGQALTSADFKFGLAIDKDSASGPLCAGTGCNVVASTSTPNKYEIDYHLKSPDASFLTSAHYGEVWPTKWPGTWSTVRAAALKLFDSASYTFEGLGYPTNGPYQVSQFNPHTSRLVLAPMKYYHVLNCGGYVKKIRFSLYNDDGSMIAAAAGNHTDTTTGYLLDTTKTLLSHNAYHTAIKTAFFPEHLELNQDPLYKGKSNPLHDVRVRVALALAINKIHVMQKALGISASAAKRIEAYSPLTNTGAVRQPYADKSLNGQWDPIAGRYVQSGSSVAIKDAKRLLAEAGFSNGLTLDFRTTITPASRITEMDAVASDWRKIGVQSNLEPQPTSQFFGNWSQGGTLDHGEFQAALFAWVGGPDPDSYRTGFGSKFIDRQQKSHSPINQNYTGMHDATIDRDLRGEEQTLNSSARARYYDDIQVRMNKNADWIEIYYRPDISTFDNRIVNGVQNVYSTAPNTWNMYQWKAR